MAFLDEGKRSADVVADATRSWRACRSVTCARSARSRRVTATFSANLARNLSGRLRRANEQVRMLAH